ncbi:hypothetical protein BU16DRAFT_595126 [Lophium mytilinum]|uniref:Uncharacterized protein n=1 Tax=Lophium mytilinum TaxID=390894 RepID=A0A6A6QKF9_9PEZI|nr:hypothetical protein BU16DRAFT_595126 [Lophium mytilinum]
MTKRKKAKTSTPRATPAKKRKYTKKAKAVGPSPRTRPIVADFSSPEPTAVAVRSSGRERKPSKFFGEDDTPEPARAPLGSIVPKITTQDIIDAVRDYRPIRPPTPTPPRSPTPPPRQFIKFKTQLWYPAEIQEEIQRREKLQKAGEVAVRVYFDPVIHGKRVAFEEVKWKALRGQAEYLLASHTTVEGWVAFKKNCEDGYLGDKQMRWVSLLDVDRGDFGLFAAWAEEWTERKEAAEIAKLEKRKERSKRRIRPSASKAPAPGRSVPAEDVDGDTTQGTDKLRHAFGHASLNDGSQSASTAAAERGANAIQPLEMEIEEMEWPSVHVHQQRQYIDELVRAWLFANTYFLSEFQNYIMRSLIWHTRKMTGTSLQSHPANLGVGLRGSWCESGIPLFDGHLLKKIWRATEEPNTLSRQHHEWSGGKLRDFVYAAMVEAYYPESVPSSVWGAIIDWDGAHRTCDLGGSRRVWQVGDEQACEITAWDSDTFAEKVSPNFLVDVEDRKNEMQTLICKDEGNRNVVWERAQAKKPNYDKYLALKKQLGRHRMQGKMTGPSTRNITSEEKEVHVKGAENALHNTGVGIDPVRNNHRRVRFDLPTDHNEDEDRARRPSQNTSSQETASDLGDSAVRPSTPIPEQLDLSNTYDNSGNIFDIPDIIVTDVDDDGVSPETVKKEAIDLTEVQDDHDDEDENESEHETTPHTIILDDQDEEFPDPVNLGTIDLTELSDGHSSDSSDSDEEEGEGDEMEVDGITTGAEA